MSTPVVTDKWAGNFDCDFCRRKRLMGNEFSKKALERYRLNGGKLKCKQCVQKQEEEERKAAAAKRAVANNSTATSNETIKCKSCQKSLDASHFNRNQWSKGEGKARCRACVEKSLQEEREQQESSKEAKLKDAREKVRIAQTSGDSKAILKAESELAALEAELVTGLKPVKMSSGRGGGRGRGRGRGGRRVAGRGRGGR